MPGASSLGVGERLYMGEKEEETAPPNVICDLPVFLCKFSNWLTINTWFKGAWKLKRENYLSSLLFCLFFIYHLTTSAAYTGSGEGVGKGRGRKGRRVVWYFPCSGETRVSWCVGKAASRISLPSNNVRLHAFLCISLAFSRHGENILNINLARGKKQLRKKNFIND